MRISTRTWWLVFGALLIAGAALSVWLWLTGQVAAAIGVNGGFDAALAAWLALGLWRWREHPVVGRIGLIAAGTVLAAVMCNLFVMFDQQRWFIATLGVWAMSIGFYLALQLARWLLGWGHPVLGVARTLLDEAVRMRGALALLVVFFLVVPAIPLMIDVQERLSYRLQSFLTYAMIGVTSLLTLLTVVIAVTTITRELDDRQIFMTMSKPVGRAQYLLGKWLGLAVFNLLLVGVSGAGIYTYAQLIAEQPAMNAADVREAREQVLTARRPIAPRPVEPDALHNAFNTRLETLRQQDPGTYGEPGSSVNLLPDEVVGAVRQQVLAAWYALRPLDTKTYLFTGLGPAKGGAQTVQLRLKPKAAGPVPDDVVYLALRFNDYNDRVLLRKMADDKYHVIEVPTDMIDSRGNLRVDIYNTPRPDGVNPVTVNFNIADGLMMLYRVGSFEANLASAMTLLWIRLCFLGMLALAAGTFLGLPIATLLALLVAIAASGAGFIASSIDDYGPRTSLQLGAWDTLLYYPRAFWIVLVQQGDVGGGFELLVRMIGRGFMLLVPDFGAYSSTESLAFGLHIPAELLGRAALRMGVLWTGLTGLVAWLVFRRRELARVQV